MVSTRTVRVSLSPFCSFLISDTKTSKNPLLSSSVPFFPLSKDAMSLPKRNPVPEKLQRSLFRYSSPST